MLSGLQVHKELKVLIEHVAVAGASCAATGVVLREIDVFDVAGVAACSFTVRPRRRAEWLSYLELPAAQRNRHVCLAAEEAGQTIGHVLLGPHMASVVPGAGGSAGPWDHDTAVIHSLVTEASPRGRRALEVLVSTAVAAAHELWYSHVIAHIERDDEASFAALGWRLTCRGSTFTWAEPSAVLRSAKLGREKSGPVPAPLRSEAPDAPDLALARLELVPGDCVEFVPARQTAYAA